MALLEVEAAKLDLTDLQRGVIEEIITVGDLFRVLNFRAVNGLSYTYTRESTIGAAQYTSVNGTVTGNDATYDNVTEQLARVTDYADIDKQLEMTHSHVNNQRAEASRLVSKRIARKMEEGLIQGTGTLPQPSGLETLTAGLTAQQVFANNDAANGGKPILKDLDRALNLVRIGTPDAFLCNGTTITTWMEILRAHNAEQMINLPGRNRPVMGYRGIPFIRNDYILENETRGTATTATSTYVVSFDESVGVHGLIPSMGAGITIEEQTWVQGKDARRIFGRAIWGLAVKSTQAIARLRGIVN